MTILMTFTTVLENIARSPIATKIGEKLTTAKSISLSRLSRLGKGLISTHLCQQQAKPLLIVTATAEEATRWALQLQSMSWRVYLYQPLDTFPYESAQIDLETAWTRIEILAEKYYLVEQFTLSYYCFDKELMMLMWQEFQSL